MENISKTLRDEIPSMDDNKSYRFKLLTARYDPKLKRLIVPSSVNIVAEDVIHDFKTGKNVDIKCIARRVPMGQGVNGSDIQLQKIEFLRQGNGYITINGKDKGKLNLLQYLYLSNFNRANRDKPWHIKPKAGYIYEFVEPGKTAAEKLEERREIRKAEATVDSLGDDDLRVVAESLSKMTSAKTGFHYNSAEDLDVLRNKLMDFAAKNPKMMITFDEKFNMEARRVIKLAVDQGLISHDLEGSQVVWGETGNKLCLVESGNDYISTLVGFFTTKEGKQALKTIMANLEETEEA